MTDIAVIDTIALLVDPTLTTGEWQTEADSAAAFDSLLVRHAGEYFRSYAEVPGTLTQPRPGQVDRSVRIDRLLIPTGLARKAGWTHGAVGIELKRSGVKFGPVIAQAMDYLRSSWRLNGIWVQLDAVFIWPMQKHGGSIASVMAQSRIGTAGVGYHGSLKFSLGEEVLFASDDWGVRMRATNSGRKVGSR